MVREILDEARWAPSWRNTQAWNVWVLTGDALERFKDEFKAARERDDPAALDLPATAEWPQACSARTAALMKSRAETLEAAGEPADPAAALARMADLFGAPCLLVFGFDDCLAEAYASFDTGAFVQNVCLAAHDRGLGTCSSPPWSAIPICCAGCCPAPRASASWSRSRSATRGRRPGQHLRALARGPGRDRHLGLVTPPVPCLC